MDRLGKIFGPSWAPKTLPRCATWAPRRPQDATKTYPRAAQNTSQDALGSPRPPRTSKTSKMTPKSRWGTPRGLVFGAYMGAFETILARILEHFCTSSLYHLYLDVVPSLFTFFNILEALLDGSGQARWRARRSAAPWIYVYFISYKNTYVCLFLLIKKRPQGPKKGRPS